MCGIFGIISETNVNKRALEQLSRFAMTRGRDSSGLLSVQEGKASIFRADYEIGRLMVSLDLKNSAIIAGHSRLITNGLSDNQPLLRDGLVLFHNGIITNYEVLWDQVEMERELEIDSEILLALALSHLKNGADLDELENVFNEKIEGSVSCAIFFTNLGFAWLYTNNGSLYYAEKNDQIIYYSEKYPLVELGCDRIKQLLPGTSVVFRTEISKVVEVKNLDKFQSNVLPNINYNSGEISLLQYKKHNLQRCSKCILPSTMPFITFDSRGVCNYCNNYVPRNTPKPFGMLEDLVKPYRRDGGKIDCLVPFSGGRDSCFALHLIKKELKMNPVTFTYDWGMVTDLGRRNISRMTQKLKVENIIVAADIRKKRDNIGKNLSAWLKSPHLGMISLLTAGDKHFFKYDAVIRKQLGVDLSLWGINPLEVTHFKSGFLGVPPKLNSAEVYRNGFLDQLFYQYLRYKEYINNPAYVNSSIFDTLSGEYYRSIKKKTDYFHVFDFWKWDEIEINSTLEDYNWEWSKDTSTSWRIGDGTAAFYNYIYYHVVGFTEHDTFRSNQIREGMITREEALQLVEQENQPRYESIKWYLTILGFDFKAVIDRINLIKQEY